MGARKLFTAVPIFHNAEALINKWCCVFLLTLHHFILLFPPLFSPPPIGAEAVEGDEEEAHERQDERHVDGWMA